MRILLIIRGQCIAYPVFSVFDSIALCCINLPVSVLTQSPCKIHDRDGLQRGANFGVPK